MSECLADFDPDRLARAIEANQSSIYAAMFRVLPGTDFHDEERILWFITGMPYPIMNGIFRAQLEPANVDAEIERLLAPFRARRVPMRWWTGPATSPADLGLHLLAHGLRFDRNVPGLAADLATIRDDLPTPEGLTIEVVRDRATLREWQVPFRIGSSLTQDVADVFTETAAAIGLGPDSPLQSYLARLNGRPVGVSAVFYSDGVAGIYQVATVPEVRRQGVATAVTLAPLLDARRRGYRVTTLKSSDMGLGVYRRLGYEQYVTLPRYVLDP